MMCGHVFKARSRHASNKAKSPEDVTQLFAAIDRSNCQSMWVRSERERMTHYLCDCRSMACQLGWCVSRVGNVALMTCWMFSITADRAST